MANPMPLAHSNRFKANNDESYLTLSNELREKLISVLDLKNYDDECIKWTEENIEKIAYDLEFITRNDALMITLYEYFDHIGIEHTYIRKLAEKNPRLQRAFGRAKQSIGIKREKYTWINDLPVPMMLKTISNYLDIYREAEVDSANIKEQAKIAAASTNQEKTVVIEEQFTDLDGKPYIKQTKITTKVNDKLD